MRTTVLCSIVLLATYGCGSDEPTSPISVTGTYPLVSVNGQSVPADYGGCCIIESGSMTLEGDGRYAISMDNRNINNEMRFTALERGTYTVSGSTIAFVRTPGEWDYRLATGTMRGSRLTAKFGGNFPGAADQLTAVFER